MRTAINKLDLRYQTKDQLKYSLWIAVFAHQNVFRFFRLTPANNVCEKIATRSSVESLLTVYRFNKIWRDFGVIACKSFYMR